MSTLMLVIVFVVGEMPAAAGYVQMFGLVFDVTKNKIAEGLPPRPDVREMASLKRVHALLCRDKLGGDDGEFDYRDIDAIVDSLLLDPVVISQMHCGIARTAEKRATIKRNGKKRWGPGAWIAQAKKHHSLRNDYDDHFAEASGIARARIEASIREALANRDLRELPHRPPDKAERNVTLAELEEFGLLVGNHLHTYRQRAELATGRKSKGTKGEIEWIFAIHDERFDTRRY